VTTILNVTDGQTDNITVAICSNGCELCSLHIGSVTRMPVARRISLYIVRYTLVRLAGLKDWSTRLTQILTLPALYTRRYIANV